MSAEGQPPYIGLTGISTPEEATEVANIIDQYPVSTHVGAAGYLVSNHTLHGYPERHSKYPSIRTLPKLIENTTRDGIANAIHFKTDNPVDLTTDINNLIKKNVGRIDLLQLNLTNPTTYQVEEIKDSHPDLKIIMPIGKHLLSLRREQILEVFHGFADNISYLLFDGSGGKGKPFDIDIISPVYRLLKYSFPHIGFGFAGGLKPEVLIQQLGNITANIMDANFSIDAEAGLREHNEDNPHSGVFSPTKAKRFMKKAAMFFK